MVSTPCYKAFAIIFLSFVSGGKKLFISYMWVGSAGKYFQYLKSHLISDILTQVAFILPTFTFNRVSSVGLYMVLNIYNVIFLYLVISSHY